MKQTNKTTVVTAAVAASIAALGTLPQQAAARGQTSSATIQASLESRLNAMEAEMQSLRDELARARAESKQEAQENAQKIEETKQQAQQTQQQVTEAEEHEKQHHNLLYFRGGFTHMDHARNDELLINNNTLYGLGATTYNQPNNGDGYYIGAGFDYRLSDDLWGLTDVAAIDGELMFQYMNFGTSQNALVQAGTGAVISNVLAAPGAVTAGIAIENQITQFTLAASPKIKFQHILNGDLQPWIIPVGLSVNVISPPSSGVTVLTPGLMLGTGLEYRIWESLWAGLDFRYNFTGGDFNYRGRSPDGSTVILRQTNIDGLTAGAYLGFGF